MERLRCRGCEWVRENLDQWKPVYGLHRRETGPPRNLRASNAQRRPDGSPLQGHQVGGVEVANAHEGKCGKKVIDGGSKQLENVVEARLENNYAERCCQVYKAQFSAR